MKLRAVVFDFDGVIANSEPLHYRAFRDILALEGVELSEADYYTRYLGYDDVGVFRTTSVDRQQGWDEGHVRELVARKADRLEAIEREESILFPGAEAAIRRVAEMVPVAIASGALGAEIRRVLEREQLSHLFSAIVAAEDTASSKPAPDPYLRAVALLSASSGATLNAAECVAIEDSHWGLASARAAGLRTVAVAHTYSAEELVGADLIVPDITTLSVDSLRRLVDDA